ncbi:hypothetical protein DR864_27380 [Runella rosea]|uniref:Uncharacterized protein n=1 Tax=Runella rosea TaxID=2259595 RepID=A0A344TRC5_9BACT|nr:hypothetical protein [Runella rosea]AXE21196.1 hypothetical protein DR864_27380 [Runella rosea]
MANNVKYTRIEYSKTFSLGNYENEKIGLIAEVPEGTDMLQAMNEIRDNVEAVHHYRRDLKAFNQAQHIVNNPQDHLGREVTRAEQAVESFYQKYPFHRPSAPVEEVLQLEGVPSVEHKDHKEDHVNHPY